MENRHHEPPIPLIPTPERRVSRRRTAVAQSVLPLLTTFLLAAGCTGPPDADRRAEGSEAVREITHAGIGQRWDVWSLVRGDGPGKCRSDGGGGADCPPVATWLRFSQQPPGAQGISSPFTVRVEVLDAHGSRVTSFHGPVRLRMAQDGSLLGNASLRGTTIVDAVSGVATFSGLRIDQGGAGYQLKASAPGLDGAASASFVIVL